MKLVKESLSENELLWKRIVARNRIIYNTCKSVGFSDLFVGFLRWYGEFGYPTVGRYDKSGLPHTGKPNISCKKALSYYLEKFLLVGTLNSRGNIDRTGLSRWNNPNLSIESEANRHVLGKNIDVLWAFGQLEKHQKPFDAERRIYRFSTTDYSIVGEIKPDRWSSWSSRPHSNTFGSSGYRQMLRVPASFLYVDTMGLCDKDEIIVNSSEIIRHHKDISFESDDSYPND